MDDDLLLTNNPIVKAPDGLARFWFSTEPAEYYPISNSTLWLEWRLWGLHPTGYHITNLVLHVAAALLLWAILMQLSIPGAFLAALLFAVHPVNVESVAWIVQRRNVLAMLFFLLSIYTYLKAEHRANLWYWLCLVLFVLAMLSKGSVAILPVVLLGLTWWQRGRISAGEWARLAPFFVLAAALTALNVWFQTHGSGEAIRAATFPQRLAGAGAVVWFYLSKALLPLDLSFLYPDWPIETGRLLWWLPLAAALVVTVALWTRRGTLWGKALFAAGAFSAWHWRR